MAGPNAPNTAITPKTVKILMFSVTSSAADFWFWLSNLALIFGVVVVAAATFSSILFSGVREQFANERISANEAETAHANESAARAGERAAAANERAAAAERENIDLRTKLTSRTITLEQHAALVAELSPYPHSFDIETMSDPESILYSNAILKTLKDAGWKVDQTFLPLGEIWTGLALPRTKDPGFEILAQALTNAGVPWSVGDTDRDKVTIIVGNKPLPF